MSERVPAPTPRDLARELISRETRLAETIPVVGLQRVCTNVTTNLRTIVGDDGCTALLARALARTQFEHPALKDLRRVAGDDIYLDAVATGVERHGLAAVNDGIEALLTALAEILGSLIGADMVLNLFTSTAPRPRGPEERAP